MKTQKSNNKLTKNIFLGIVATSIVLWFTSHAKKIKFLNSSAVLAAKGTVKVTRDKNKNYAIKVKVSDLAEVEILRPEKQTYVVWMETDTGNIKNIGQLKSLTGLLSKQHKASLETVSPFKPIKIFVTAEQDISVRNPDSEVFLTTSKF